MRPFLEEEITFMREETQNPLIIFVDDGTDCIRFK